MLKVDFLSKNSKGESLLILIRSKNFWNFEFSSIDFNRKKILNKTLQKLLGILGAKTHIDYFSLGF